MCKKFFFSALFCRFLRVTKQNNVFCVHVGGPLYGPEKRFFSLFYYKNRLLMAKNGYAFVSDAVTGVGAFFFRWSILHWFGCRTVEPSISKDAIIYQFRARRVLSLCGFDNNRFNALLPSSHEVTFLFVLRAVFVCFLQTGSCFYRAACCQTSLLERIWL